jgi:carbon monoxide dehydrogenase subunit G
MAMDMSGTYRIPAPREVVWAALNDPEILKQAIPGCEELERIGEHELVAKVTAKIGPVKAKFAGDVYLEDLNPPASYTLRGEGRGGAAGFAKGGAKVRLEEAGDATVLTYDAEADIGGKIAQLGSRLVQGAAKKTADDFFAAFADLVARRYAEARGAEVPPVEAAPPPALPAPPWWRRPVVWVIAAAILLALVLLAS